MSRNGIFKDKNEALEKGFFRINEIETLQKFRQVNAEKNESQLMQDFCQFENRRVTDTLAEFRFKLETLVALLLIPLVEVAWADSKIEEAEREKIFSIADSLGLENNTLAIKLLKNWLVDQPYISMFSIWSEYMHELKKTLTTEDFDNIRSEILAKSKEVADASGGFLLFSSTSDLEEAILNKIEKALAS